MSGPSDVNRSDPAPRTAERSFAGPGPMRAAIRAYDWAATPLGPVERWPQSLRTAVDLCLGWDVASWIWWGPELIQLYNDAALHIARERHPAALGAPARQAWSDVWELVGPISSKVLDTGAAFRRRDDLHFLSRPVGAPGLNTFSFSFSALREESGAVAGIFITAIERISTIGRERHPAEVGDAEDRVARGERIALDRLQDANDVAARALRRVRESELRYRSLFEALEEGFCILEKVETPPDAASDFRYVVVNRAFTRHSGLENAVGRTIRELVPDADDAVIARYDHVVHTGQAVHFEAHVPSLNRWIETHAFRPAAAEPRCVAVLFTNVTERKHAEVERRANEERYRAIIEGARDYAILTIDVDGRITSWSPGAEGVFGWTEAEILGQSLEVTFVPEDRARGVPDWDLAEARRTGSAPDVGWHQRRDGERVFIEGTTRALRDERGELRGFLKIGQDVTRRRELDAALRASEARIRDLIEHVTDYAIFGLDTEGYITEWTAGAERVKGYTADEVIGRHEVLFFTPEDVLSDRPARELAEAAVTGRAEFEGWRIRRNGERVWVNEIATAVRDEEGRVVGFTKISRDLTERRQIDEALRRSEARFRAIANVVPDLLWQGEPDGTISWYNDRWYAYTGQSTSASPVDGWSEVIHPDDLEGWRAAYSEAISGRRPFSAEQRLRGADGSYRWFLLQGAPLFDATEEVVQWFGAAADIHVQREAFGEVERRVKQRTAELARANAALANEASERARLQAVRDALRRQLALAEEAERGRLSRELHDQLGQELTAFALGLNEAIRLATRDVGPDAPLLMRLGQLEALSRRMTTTARYVALELRPPELDDVGFESALESYVAQWTARYDIAADVAIAGVPERPVPSDVASVLYRAAQEALNNVAKHARASQVSVIVEKSDEELGLIVEDDGGGFDVDATMQRARRERRLGLAGMRERAALVGGRLSIESSPGRGTALYLRVPVGRPADGTGDGPLSDRGSPGDPNSCR